MGMQCYCLRWNNYQRSVSSVVKSLLEEEQFVDVTLACDGKQVKAHKLILSACSTLFAKMLKDNDSDHPIIFMRDVRFWELQAIMDFIYNGQVNILEDQLPEFIRTAESLKIKGLAVVGDFPSKCRKDELTFSPEIAQLHEKVRTLEESALSRKRAAATTEPTILPSKKSRDNSSISRISPEVDSVDPLSLTLEDKREISEDTLSNASSEEGTLVVAENPKDSDGECNNGESLSPVNYSDNGLPVCHVCGKVFKHQGSLVAHYQVHQSRTKCPICRKILSRHYHMKVHLLTVHKVPDSHIDKLLRIKGI